MSTTDPAAGSQPGTPMSVDQAEALRLIRRGIYDPGATLPRDFHQGPERDEYEPIWSWGARAALENLRAAGLLTVHVHRAGERR
jgi:hypothetical protein